MGDHTDERRRRDATEGAGAARVEPADARTTNFDRLPPAYRRALELDAAGAPPARIGEQLDVPVEAVPALLRLARAKADAVGETAGDE
jgi:DNA-directed RNA polymerase specialized sigma24 family protein